MAAPRPGGTSCPAAARTDPDPFGREHGGQDAIGLRKAPCREFWRFGSFGTGGFICTPPVSRAHRAEEEPDRVGASLAAPCRAPPEDTASGAANKGRISTKVQAISRTRRQADGA